MFEGLSATQILDKLEQLVIDAREALELQGYPEDCLVCASLDDAQEGVAVAAEMVKEETEQ